MGEMLYGGQNNRYGVAQRFRRRALKKLKKKNEKKLFGKKLGKKKFANNH